MFCPRCGHQQVSGDTRFCARCGLSLGTITDLLNGTNDQVEREKLEIRGVGLTMATALMLINFLIVFGAVTLPHLGISVFLWLWLGFVISALIIGGFGLTNLIRGGFFKRLKEREARRHLMQFARNRQILPEQAGDARLNAEAVPRLFEPASVTETTTRELQSISSQTSEPSRKKEITIQN